MSDKNIKALRGQVRQAVKELMPEIIKSESYQAIMKAVEEKLRAIEKQVLDTLEAMQNRQKDLQNYIMREVTLSTSPAPKVTEENPANEQKAEESKANEG